MYNIPGDLPPSGVLCFIGKAQSGKVLEPYYCESYLETISEFRDGEVLDAYKCAYDLGVKDIYIIRINYDTIREKYHQIKRAYEILEFVQPHLVCPLDTSIDEKIHDYVEINLKEENFYIKEKTDTISLEKNILNLEKFKINGNFLYNYIVEGKKIKLPQPVKKESYVEVSYYPEEEKSFDLKVVVFEKNKFKKQKEISINYNPHNKKTSYGKKLKEYFDFTKKEYVDKYTLKNKDDFTSFFTDYKNIKFDEVIQGQKNGVLISPSYTPDNFDKANIKGVQLNIESNLKYFKDGLYQEPNGFALEAFSVYFMIDGKEYKLPLSSIGELYEFKKSFDNFSFRLETNTDVIIEEIDIGFVVESTPQELQYFIKHDYNYVNFYADIDGDSDITIDFEPEKYWEKTIEKKYFYNFISKKSRELGLLSFLGGPQETNQNFSTFLASENINIPDSCFVISAINNCFYTSLAKNKNSSIIIAANIARNPTNINFSNKTLEGVGDFKEYKSNLDEPDRFCFLIQTIRNGIVIKKASTFASSKKNFFTIKDMRVALEFKRRWNNILENKYIGNKIQENLIEKDLTDLLEAMVSEGKITDYQYKFDHKETFVSLFIDHEIDLVEYNILGDD